MPTTDVPALDLSTSPEAPTALRSLISSAPALDVSVSPEGPTDLRSMILGVPVLDVSLQPSELTTHKVYFSAISVFDIGLNAAAGTDEMLPVFTPIKLAPPGAFIAGRNGVAAQPWTSWAATVSAIATAVINSGTSSQRPDDFLFVGRPYFDATLNKTIWYNGRRWVDGDGNDA